MIILGSMKRRSNESMHYGAAPKLFEFAQGMRKNPTETERLFWEILISPPFAQYNFRQQHPISTFIADFYSHKLKLVIEVDGGYHLHKEQQAFDNFRDTDMNALSISVLRFTNNDILNSSPVVIEKIQEFISVSLTR
jgi:very-short-patch-repair endonuclease